MLRLLQHLGSVSGLRDAPSTRSGKAAHKMPQLAPAHASKGAC